MVEVGLLLGARDLGHLRDYPTGVVMGYLALDWYLPLGQVLYLRLMDLVVVRLVQRRVDGLLQGHGELSDPGVQVRVVDSEEGLLECVFVLYQSEIDEVREVKPG